MSGPSLQVLIWFKVDANTNMNMDTLAMQVGMMNIDRAGSNFSMSLLSLVSPFSASFLLY